MKLSRLDNAEATSILNLDMAEAPRRTLSICRSMAIKIKELKSKLKLRHTLLQRHKKDSNKSKFEAI